MAVKLSLLGHSFIRRLKEEVLRSGSRWENLNLRASEVEVNYLGKGGGKVRDITSRLFSEHLSLERPDAVVLQIGGNDVDGLGADPIRIARDIITVAEWMIVGFGVKHVTIMQLLFRKITRQIPLQRYNDMVCLVNSELKARLAERSDIHYHKHRGLKRSVTNIYLPDGVHLNRQYGVPKYVRSVRGAVIATYRRC